LARSRRSRHLRQTRRWPSGSSVDVSLRGSPGAYYDSKQIPITLPIFIAITALARLTILQKEQEPMNIIYEATAILLLAIASVVVNLRASNFGIGRRAETLVPEPPTTRKSVSLNFSLCDGRDIVTGALLLLQRFLALRRFAFEEVRRGDSDLRLAGAIRYLLNAVLIPAIIFAGDRLLAGAAPHDRGQVRESELIRCRSRKPERILALIGYDDILNRKNAGLRHL
jgi:hypothetical protein